MGLRPNWWVTVWEVSQMPSGKSTRIRISTRKKKEDGTFEQDFSGSALCIGQAHDKAANLKPKDRIKVLDFEITNSYDKEAKKEHTFYKFFDIEVDNSQVGNGGNTTPEAFPPEQEGDTGDNLLF